MNFYTNLWSWFTGRSSTSNVYGDQTTAPSTMAYQRSKKVPLDKALQLSSFWAAVNRWVNTLSSLPLNIQEWDGQQWVDVQDNEIQSFLNYKVNRYQTRIEFIKSIAFDLVANGNSYAHISKTGNKITSLLPLSATQMTVKVLDNNDVLYIKEQNGKQVPIKSEEIWHLKLFGNNFVGMSPLSFGANAINMGLSADERTTQVLDNAAKPSGILTFDGESKLNDEQRQELQRKFKNLKEGTDNVLMTLEKGWEYQQVGLNPQDVQLLESKRFTVEDIGRFLDVPSILLNDSTSSTGWGTGIGEILDGWYKLSLRPMSDYISQSMAIHLLTASQRKKMRFNFDFDRFLQLSRKERAEANQKEINSGTMTPNEARLSEGRLPKDGGDELLINTALQPIDQYLQDLANARGETNEV